MQHLRKKLLHDVPFVKHAHYLHPEKRHQPGATSSKLNFTLSIFSGHKNCLQDVFSVNSPVTCEKIVDMVQNQWFVYQKEVLKEVATKIQIPNLLALLKVNIYIGNRLRLNVTYIHTMFHHITKELIVFGDILTA